MRNLYEVRVRYFVISRGMADSLGLTPYRIGNGKQGYLVNVGDLVAYGVENALMDGAREVTEEEADEFVKSISS